MQHVSTTRGVALVLGLNDDELGDSDENCASLMKGVRLRYCNNCRDGELLDTNSKCMIAVLKSPDFCGSVELSRPVVEASKLERAPRVIAR